MNEAYQCASKIRTGLSVNSFSSSRAVSCYFNRKYCGNHNLISGESSAVQLSLKAELIGSLFRRFFLFFKFKFLFANYFAGWPAIIFVFRLINLIRTQPRDRPFYSLQTTPGVNQISKKWAKINPGSSSSGDFHCWI